MLTLGHIYANAWTHIRKCGGDGALRWRCKYAQTRVRVCCGRGVRKCVSEGGGAHRHYIVFFPTFVHRDKGERVDPQRKDKASLEKHLIQIFQE